ncbi:hypothetical protein [Sphingobium aquiterrae]|uniref:hypothetical protein n=1 Tax=Sphingobium aquiterrae TaxID=2038656 RepID=UPI0030167425
MTNTRFSARSRRLIRGRAPVVRPAAALPVPHPSWFGQAVDPAERLAPDQFWARLGL